MIHLTLNSKTPGLLVSVRDPAEALTALDAGADVIDVKEPNRGPLGAADAETIVNVVRAVDGRAPVSAASGELNDLTPAVDRGQLQPVAGGVSLFKIGLAGCSRTPNWQSRWRSAIAALQGDGSTSAQPVAVVYADWQAAGAPNPDEVLKAAVELHCPALLIDTWDKAAGALFDHWTTNDLRAFLDRVRTRQLAVVLAGSLKGESFARAVQLAPDLVAVRGAACDVGRRGTVAAERVRALKQVIASSHITLRTRPAFQP